MKKFRNYLLNTTSSIAYFAIGVARPEETETESLSPFTPGDQVVVPIRSGDGR